MYLEKNFELDFGSLVVVVPLVVDKIVEREHDILQVEVLLVECP